MPLWRQLIKWLVTSWFVAPLFILLRGGKLVAHMGKACMTILTDFWWEHLASTIYYLAAITFASQYVHVHNTKPYICTVHTYRFVCLSLHDRRSYVQGSCIQGPHVQSPYVVQCPNIQSSHVQRPTCTRYIKVQMYKVLMYEVHMCKVHIYKVHMSKGSHVQGLYVQGPHAQRPTRTRTKCARFTCTRS